MKYAIKPAMAGALFLVFILCLSCQRTDSGTTSDNSKSHTTHGDSLNLVVQRFTVSIPYGKKSFEENVYLLTDKNSGQGLIVDPGVKSRELEKIIDTSRISVQGILNTHGHFDHIGANGIYKAKYKAEIYAHTADKSFYRNRKNFPTHWIRGEQDLKLGVFTVRVLHTPGHSPGSCCFLVGKYLFTGDTLFKGTIGRTPDGNATKRLVQNVKQKLLTLPMDTVVYPGHGETTLLEAEKRENPFLQDGRQAAEKDAVDRAPQP